MPSQAAKPISPRVAAILCESCGYDITSLEPAMNCSECGRPVASSLPESRRGSPFQNRPALGSLAATWWLALVRPSSLFDAIRIDPTSSRLLLRTTLVIAGILLSPGPWTDFARIFHDAPALAWMFNVAVGTLALWILTRIEMIGIRTFGNRHGWRITPQVATAVCAHASVGWILTGILFLVSVMLPFPNFSITLPASFGAWSVNIGVIAAPTLALLVGLVVFELLVYLGVRRCKYANHARGQVPAEAVPARTPPATA